MLNMYAVRLWFGRSNHACSLLHTLPGSELTGNRKSAIIIVFKGPSTITSTKKKGVTVPTKKRGDDCANKKKGDDCANGKTKTHRFMLIVAWQPDQRPPVQHGIAHQRRAHRVPVSLCSAGVDGRELAPPIGNEHVLQQENTYQVIST
jgi:hypothetical protein